MVSEDFFLGASIFFRERSGDVCGWHEVPEVLRTPGKQKLQKLSFMDKNKEHRTQLVTTEACVENRGLQCGITAVADL